MISKVGELTTTKPELQPAILADREASSMVIIIALSSSIGPHGVIVRMESLSEVFSVFGNVDEHDYSCGRFDGPVGFRDD